MSVAKLSLVVALSFAAGGTSRAADKPAKAPAELQGCWKLVSVEMDEMAREPFGGGQPRWVVKDDKVFFGGEEIFKFTADTTTSPRIIDLKFSNPDRVYEGVYVVEKDKLKVCLNRYSDGKKNRPSMFTTKDQDDWRLLVFEREKAAPANAIEGLTPFVGLMLKNDDDTNAPTVVSALKGSPAEKAGIKKDDIVLQVGKTVVADLQETIKAVRAGNAGENLDIKVRRDGKEKTITVKVGVFPFPMCVGLE